MYDLKTKISLCSDNCCPSVAQSCLTLCNPMDCHLLGILVPHHLLEFAQVHVHCIFDAIQPAHPLMPSLLLLSVFPSMRDFPDESSVCIRWPKYWSFSLSISPSGEYSGSFSLKIGLTSLLSNGLSVSSPALQFKGINSLAFCLVFGTALTTVLDHWEDLALTMDLCHQSNISALQHTV